MSPRHTDAVNNYVLPKDKLALQRFLGLTNYCRKFIPDYALKAKPLPNSLKKNVEFNFDNSCLSAFNLLKKELTSSPVLKLYDPAAETQFHTDARSAGLGAILLQKQKDNLWGPIAYYSQGTNSAESRYHSYKLEMLAIVKAVERFHAYLYGVQFLIVTDCNALVYAVTKANLNPRIARWTLSLQNYTFSVTHRPGKRMAHVDALSRCIAYVNEPPLESRLELLQLTDPKILELSKNLEFFDNDKFALINGLVYKKIGDHLKFVVPESMITNLLRAHHDEAAHCRHEKTIMGIRQNFWFPAMRKKVHDYIDNCLTCLTSNSSVRRFEGETCLYPLPEKPLEIIHVDHFGPLQETSDNFKHILVVVDAFTRFIWLYPTKTTSAKEVIKNLLTLINIFGKPTELVSDRGTAFSANEFQKFVNEHGIKHRKVAVAAPWANGLAERVNKFLKSSLTKLIDSPNEWKANLGKMQYAINNTYHSVIKATPSKLMLEFDQKNHIDHSLAQFTKVLSEGEENLQKDSQSSRDVAFQATNLIRNYNKDYKDARRSTPSQYNEGDYVLIRNTSSKVGISSKLKPKYKGPYMIAKNLGCNRYVVKDIPGFNIIQKPLDTILSSDRLKPWVKLIDPERKKQLTSKDVIS